MNLTLGLLATLPIMLVGSAIASGMETALFTLTHGERERLARLHPAAARAVARLLAQPRRLLIFILLANMLANVLYFVVSAVAATQAERATVSTAISVGSVVAIILFGEVFAKLVARANRMAYCRVLAAPLAGARTVAGPLISLVDAAAITPLQRLVRPTAGVSRSLTASELAELVGASAEAGELDRGENSLIAGVIRLRAVRAAEIMRSIRDVPRLTRSARRDDVLEAVGPSASAVALIVSQTDSRHVLGVLDVKRYLADPRRDPPVTRHAARPLFIPETAGLDAVLAQIREEGSNLAVCVDERGHTAGLLDLDRIIEELLEAATDEDAPPSAVEAVAPGVWMAPGSLTLRAADAMLGGTAPGIRGVRTVAGLILHRLGRIPREGDVVDLDGARLRVDAMTGRRIDRVEIALTGSDSPPRPGSPDAAQSEGGP